MTQCQQILQMIDENGSVTTMEAFAEGITRLASRVHDLRKMGYDIISEPVTGRNRHGKPIHYARYKRRCELCNT